MCNGLSVAKNCVRPETAPLKYTLQGKQSTPQPLQAELLFGNVPLCLNSKLNSSRN